MMAEFDYIDDEEPSFDYVEEKPKTRKADAIDQFLPRILAERGGRGKAEFEKGDLNILGDLFNRPGAAVRAGIRGAFDPKKSIIDEFIRGSNDPESVESFQDEFIRKSQNSTSVTENFLKGLLPSTVGLVADYLTNPGDILSTISGAKAAKVIGDTSVGKAFSEIANRDIQLSKITDPVLKRLPRIMNDSWIEKQAYNAKGVLDGIDDALSNSYDDIYKRVGGFKVDANKIDDIILNSNLDDAAMSDIDRIVGKGSIDTVDKARAVIGVLRKRTPDSFYLSGGTTGKGGLANSKIRQIDTIAGIRDVLTEGIEASDKDLANNLKSLNAFASQKVYPTLKKMRSIVGKDRIPSTEGIAETYRLGAFGKASQRQTIRSTPKISKEFKKYISQDYVSDLKELTANSRQLVKDMGKFRMRSAVKAGVGTAAAFGGAGYVASKLSGN